jgi:uncharacterized membrane protein YdbT with pleckstrin-like domain
MGDQGRNDDDRKAARLRGFKLHLGTYFSVITVLVAINMLTTPGTPWFVWPMVGWGPVLAVHTAWAMGLFDSLLHGK